MTLEYDGTAFSGWAAQPGLRTVEGELRRALDAVFPAWEGLAVAGRTDAGVHARGQVASFSTDTGPPPERAAEALNKHLPDDVAAIASEAAPDDFHARFSASARTYRYRIWLSKTPSPFEERRSLWHPRPLDEERLHALAALLPGEHDFRAFTPTDTQHEVFVRIVEEARWERDGDALISGSPPTASCATWCERWSARCSAPSRTRSRSCWKAAAETRRERPRRRGACTSSA